MTERLTARSPCCRRRQGKSRCYPALGASEIAVEIRARLGTDTEKWTKEEAPSLVHLCRQNVADIRTVTRLFSGGP